jgi:hypothetical protein
MHSLVCLQKIYMGEQVMVQFSSSDPSAQSRCPSPQAPIGMQDRLLAQRNSSLVQLGEGQVEGRLILAAVSRHRQKFSQLSHHICTSPAPARNTGSSALSVYTTDSPQLFSLKSFVSQQLNAFEKKIEFWGKNEKFEKLTLRDISH